MDEPPSPTTRSDTSRRLSSPSTKPGTPSRAKTPAETEALLKHELRQLKAENANLREKLGTKQSYVPFGQSLPRRASEGGPTLAPPPSSLARRASSSNPSDLSNGDRATSPLPGAVSLTRALLPDADTPSSPPLDASTGDRLSASTGSSRANGASTRIADQNPFFGSGNSRERMKNSAASANSGSGKVISGLQSELISVKSTLDAVRSQLRLSQKAVEHLTKQNDDLKESKERFNSETDGLAKMLSRKERLHDELQTRATVAESSLASLQQNHQELATTSEARIAELEQKCEEAEGSKAKAESEYESLRGGMKSMADGWRADLDWLKADLVKVEAKHQRELDDLKLKHAALTKLFKAKEAEHTDVKTALASAAAAQRSIVAKYETTVAELRTRLDAAEKSGEVEKALATAETLNGEFVRLRRMMRDHALASTPGLSPSSSPRIVQKGGAAMHLPIEICVPTEAELPRLALIKRRAFWNSVIHQRIYGAVTDEAYIHWTVNKLKRFIGPDAGTSVLRCAKRGEDILAYGHWDFIVEKEKAEKVEEKDEVAQSLEGMDMELDVSFHAHFKRVPHPPTYHHLRVLVVDPTVQSSGAGTALLDWGLALADQAQLETHLEAVVPAVAFYERKGFTQHSELIKADADGAVQVLPMVRLPISSNPSNPTSLAPLQILPAELADAPAIADIDWRAFINGQPYGRLFGRCDPVAWKAHMAKEFAAHMGKKDRVLLKAVREGRVVGFGLWFLPKHGREPEEAEEEPTFAEGTEVEAALSFFGLLGEISKARSTPHYYIQLLAVDPDVQRTGAGKALIKWGIDEAAKAGLGCALEASPEGLRMYESMGFELIGEPIVALDGDVLVRVMERPFSGPAKK
ncbi:hypothetical protein MNV49_004060 [Pseudohyphozyma bogoriensis]|nr:hypothetical protein MNV49_004060 [Pseudohyphozyma bogoriensis]